MYSTVQYSRQDDPSARRKSGTYCTAQSPPCRPPDDENASLSSLFCLPQHAVSTTEYGDFVTYSPATVTSRKCLSLVSREETAIKGASGLGGDSALDGSGNTAQWPTEIILIACGSSSNSAKAGYLVVVYIARSFIDSPAYHGEGQPAVAHYWRVGGTTRHRVA